MAQFTCNFYSYTLKYAVDISIVVPSYTPLDLDNKVPMDHTVKEKFPVLYMLHGFGGDHRVWLRYTNIERLVEEYRIALVTFSTDNKAYMNIPDGDQFYDFLNEELPSFVKGFFPISDRVEDTYIGGLSMGGYGALTHGLSQPQKYRAIGAMSSGIDFSRNDPVRVNTFELVEKNIKENKKMPDIFLTCGREDFLYEANVKFHELLEEKGIEHVWRDIPGYEHEWGFWDAELVPFLDWLPRTDTYAKMPKNKV